jgi:hypothetical protein
VRGEKFNFFLQKTVLDKTEKPDLMGKDQENRQAYSEPRWPRKLSIITLAKNLFSSKKNQEDMQDWAGPTVEEREDKTEQEDRRDRVKRAHGILMQ